MRIFKLMVIAIVICFIGFRGIHCTKQSYEHESQIEATLENTAMTTQDIPVSQPEEAAIDIMQTKQLPADIAAKKVDFNELETINQDIVAWIYIPAVDISYPVLQGKDNNEYLHRSFDGKKSSTGAVFMNCANVSDLSDDNTFIFAHNMKNGTMFGALKSFVWKKDTIDIDPYIWIFTREATYQYEIFSAYNTTKSSDMYIVAKDHNAYVQKALKQSAISHPCKTDGRLLTLSTCAGVAGSGQRLLIHASLNKTY